jgi:Tol biopolymer transport system component
MTRTVRIELAAVLAVVLAVLGYSRIRGHGESPADEKRIASATEEASTDETGAGGVQMTEGQPVVSGGRSSSGASRAKQGSSSAKGSRPTESLPEGTISRGFEIAFQRGEEGSWSIYLMNAEGSDLRRVRAGVDRGSHLAPGAWSPDGKLIAFTDHRGYNQGEIQFMNSDGSGVQNLPARGSFPTWSPDGGRLAFNRECDAQFGGPCEQSDGTTKDCGPECGIGVVSRDGTGVRRLGNGISPDWGPDGRIVFSDGTCNARPNSNYPGLQCPFPIWVMNPDGSGRIRLPVDEAISPTWSHDGRRIAYYTETGVFIANSDGTGIVKVAPEGYVEPSWSPDGLWLALTRYVYESEECFTPGSAGCSVGGLHNIYLRGIDGSAERRLTSSNNDLRPAFSPRR